MRFHANVVRNQTPGACFHSYRVSMRAPRRRISCQIFVPTGKTQLFGSDASIFEPAGSQIQRDESAPSSHIVAPGVNAFTSGAILRCDQSE